MFIFIVLFFVSFAHAYSSEYHTLEQNIASISADPRSVLSALEEQLESDIHKLSAPECTQLIEQLSGLKKMLCNRPRGGLLAGPITATVCLGIQALMSYFDSKYITESKSWIIYALDGGKSKEKFIEDVWYFLIAAALTFWVELEYCQATYSLFSKERILEQKLY